MKASIKGRIPLTIYTIAYVEFREDNGILNRARSVYNTCLQKLKAFIVCLLTSDKFNISPLHGIRIHNRSNNCSACTY